MAKIRSKNETKRKQILAAATILFTEQGYASTSMDLIGKQAEVSKQTVYSHFGSKDELFSAAIQHKCESSQMFDLSSFDLSDPQSTLLSLAHRFINVLTSKEGLAIHKVCAFESKAYPQLSELYYQAGPIRITGEVAELMKAFNQKNILSIKNPWHAALQFLNLMKGELWMQMEFNIKDKVSSQEVDDYLSSSVALFIRGYS
ncbi:MAG: TetR/AcrR family transcriptional regulator [Alteromonadaceae bacterium]|nr:TetR/AcrR family transcriptional regulator [Alteromonadaceae bacterium]